MVSITFLMINLFHGLLTVPVDDYIEFEQLGERCEFLLASPYVVAHHDSQVIVNVHVVLNVHFEEIPILMHVLDC